MTRCLTVPAIAGLAAFLIQAIADPAQAQRRQLETREEFVLTRPAGIPLMAVVSLADQRVTIYDASAKIMRAPVSTGQTGYETPVGIYSVIQKEAEHYSNLYDDASMPFMQRITWSGIALHAGALPGYPASHGCIRMPHGFAERLFELTKTGMRVVIVRGDIAPVAISHPALFKSGPIRSSVALAAQAQTSDRPLHSMRLRASPADAGPGRATWRSIAAAKAAAADEAAKKTEDARRIAVQAGGEASRVAKALRFAGGALLRARAQIRNVGRMFEGAGEPAAAVAFEELQSEALERLSDAQKQLNALEGEAQAKIDAAIAAREQVKAAQTAWVAAQNEAEIAVAKAAPISVLISRKTQRLYARQAFQPIFESAVTIQNPEALIGTIIFTALSYADDGAELRWSALGMYADPTKPGTAQAPGSRLRPEGPAEPVLTDASAASAALERIGIPQEVLDQISEFVSPGASLIISDEEASRETGKDTEFVVLMSGEPQGGIKIRRRIANQ
jgi:hypothetical protein